MILGLCDQPLNEISLDLLLDLNLQVPGLSLCQLGIEMPITCHLIVNSIVLLLVGLLDELRYPEFGDTVFDSVLCTQVSYFALYSHHSNL
jgi:hypothetical protein